MPCDTVQTSTVEFRPEHADFFAKALKSLGYEVTVEDGFIQGSKGYAESVTLQDGKLEIRSASNISADVFKRAYSREIVTFAAEQFGFELTQTSENSFEAQKVGF